MAVQARFYVAEIRRFARNTATNTRPGYADPAPYGEVTLRPVTRGAANADWASATPSGQIVMTVAAKALDWFDARLASEVAITFDDRPEAETQAPLPNA